LYKEKRLDFLKLSFYTLMTQIISQAMTTRVVKCHNWQWRRRDDDL